MTRQAIQTLLDKISGCYMVKLTPASLDAWDKALSRINDIDGLRAAEKYIEEESRTPRPADIISRARAIRAALLIEEEPEKRLARLNRSASLSTAERLRLRDHDEIRFQIYMARKKHATGELRDSDHPYFRRWIGSDWMDLCGIEGVEEYNGPTGEIRGDFPDGTDQMAGIEESISPNTLNKYGMVCLRQDEWVFSFPAQADVPPCIACYSSPGVKNCDLPQVRECSRAILKLPVPKDSPAFGVKVVP